MTYPYEGRDLFAHPETYFFAQCDGANFLDEWRKSRQKAARRIAKGPHQDQESPDVQRSVSRQQGVALADILEPMLKVLTLHPDRWPEAANELESFVIKYEVHKRLFSRYDQRHRRIEGSGTASTGIYVTFAECLAKVAQAGNSLKHLSTLLKICDALASLPAQTFTAAETERFLALLKLEEALVAQVA